MSEVFNHDLKALSPLMAEDVIKLIDEKLSERDVEHEDGEYLSIRKASKKFDIPEPTLRKWIAQKRLKTYPSKVGRLIRIKVSELMELE